MLQLMQVLYSIRHKAFSMWSLTVAEWDFPSCSEASTWTAKKESQGFRQLTAAAHGVMIDGGYADLLRVHYEKPGKTPKTPPVTQVPSQAQSFHTFTTAEIRRCAQEISDPCTDHQEGRIVPPLLLLKTLLQQYPIHSGQIRFYAPIPPETPILLARTTAGMEGYANQVRLFDLSMN